MGAPAKASARPLWPHLRPPRLGGAVVFLIAALLLLPFAWLALRALQGAGSSTLDWAETAMSLGVTLAVVAGTMAATTVMGVGAAWLCVMCRFPGSHIMKACMLLPLTMPPYLLAYAYSGMLEEAGATFFRGTFAVVASLSFATYPYVFLFSTVAFLLLPCHLFSTARVLGLTPLRTFFRVAVPIARPAIVAGLALVMMETMGDFGVAEYFGVQTLSVAVYDTWLNRGDFAGAAQLSLLVMAVTFLVLFVERAARLRRGHYSRSAKGFCAHESYRLAGVKAWLAAGACALLLGAAFIVPLGRLAWLGAQAGSAAWARALGDGAVNSLTLALAVSCAVLAVGVVLSVGSHQERGRRSPARAVAAKAALIGYAFPGTLLALAVLGTCFAVSEAFGPGAKAAVATTSFMLYFGLVIKFAAITYGACESGLKKIPPSMSSAARISGMGTLETMLRVHLPLLRPALLASLMLVFVDVVKELPLTLLLRPPGFGTLATRVFEYASDEELLLAAPAGLLLVAMCLPAMTVLRNFMEHPWKDAGEVG